MEKAGSCTVVSAKAWSRACTKAVRVNFGFTNTTGAGQVAARTKRARQQGDAAAKAPGEIAAQNQMAG